MQTLVRSAWVLMRNCSYGQSFGFDVCLFHATVSGLKELGTAAIGEVLEQSLLSPGDTEEKAC